MSSPRILYVSPNGYLGGAERFVLSAARAHADAGTFRPAVLFFNDGEAVAEARRLDLEVHVLATPFKLTAPAQLLRALRELRALVRALGPDVIHATMAYAQLVLGLALLREPRKVVWFQHGPVGGQLDLLATLFPCDLLLFNSLYLRDLHHRAFPHSRFEREAVLALGVPATPGHRELFTGETVVFGAAGRVTPFKAFEEIFEALAVLPGNFEFRLAGAPKLDKDEAYLRRLRSLVADRGLAEKVRFLGHVDDMGAFYRGLDVFVHSARGPEPFGLVLAEAMGQGCLVVARPEGGAREFVRPEVTALTYGTMTELAAQLARILALRSALAGIAERGQRHIRERHGTEGMRLQLEELYRLVLR